jgi:hypothetical protein
VQRQLAREGIDVSDGLTQGLDELRAVTRGLVNGYNAGGRGSLTTGPW